MSIRNVLTKATRKHLSGTCHQPYVALLCPGQGSQYTGMFQNRNKTDRNVTLLLEKGREVFSDELIQLGKRGPINELNRYVCL